MNKTDSTLMDDQDAGILRIRLLEAHLAEIRMPHSAEPILLNRTALNFVIESLRKTVANMSDDPNMAEAAIYDPKSRRPWWQSMGSGADSAEG